MHVRTYVHIYAYLYAWMHAYMYGRVKFCVFGRENGFHLCKAITSSLCSLHRSSSLSRFLSPHTDTQTALACVESSAAPDSLSATSPMGSVAACVHAALHASKDEGQVGTAKDSEPALIYTQIQK